MEYEESGVHHRLTGRDEGCSQQELGVNKNVEEELEQRGGEGEVWTELQLAPKRPEHCKHCK